MKNTVKILSGMLIISALIFAMASCSKSYEAAGDAGYPESGNSFNGGTVDKGDGEIENLLENDRKIIKNVNESVQTDRFDDFLEALNEAVNYAGGYISSSNYSGESYYNSGSLRRANLTVRIPAERLSEFTEKVDCEAVVTYYNESMSDVTLSYIDVESKIAVLEAEEEALLEILKKASTTSDALLVRTRLTELQGDLASLRAQKKSYDDKISYSTVTITVSEVRRVLEENPGFFKEVSGTFSDSLYDIGQGLRSFVVWFLGNIIYILLVCSLAVGAFFSIKYVIRRAKRKNNCD